MNKKNILLVFMAWGTSLFSVTPPIREQANRIFDRLASVPLSLKDPRRAQIEALLEKGDRLGAAKVATDDDGFYNVTLFHWASSLSVRAESPVAPLSDFIAMVIGSVRDDRDFREILSGDFTYVGPSKEGEPAPPLAGNPNHYAALENAHLNLRKVLTRVEPQRPDFPDAAGVLTSNAWGAAHLADGTNRRAVEYSFREFLCTNMSDLADGSVPDIRIRRDVDRSPGGSSQTFLTTCRRCHAGMDGLTGAYAYYRYGFGFDGGFFNRVFHDPKVQKKMNKNGEVYRPGYITVNDSWVNFFTENQNTAIGWRGPLEGHGVQSFGRMLSNSKAFSACMVKRVFTDVCHRSPKENEKGLLENLATSFEKNGYRLRQIFEQAAISPGCLGSES